MGGETALDPFALMDSGRPSLDHVILVESAFLMDISSGTPCCCISSMRLRDGTSPSQYLCHMFRYVVSKPRVKFGPSQTGDLDIRSRRLILKFERAEMSEASCSANRTYSSSFLATKCPNPALQSARRSAVINEESEHPQAKLQS